MLSDDEYNFYYFVYNANPWSRVTYGASEGMDTTQFLFKNKISFGASASSSRSEHGCCYTVRRWKLYTLLATVFRCVLGILEDALRVDGRTGRFRTDSGLNQFMWELLVSKNAIPSIR